MDFKAGEEIPVLSSKDQIILQKIPLLGMDTEMLFTENDKIIWPHTIGFPQEREPENDAVSGKTRNSQRFDFHGDGYAMELCVPAVHCLEYMMEDVGRAFKWAKNNKKISATGNLSIEAPPVYSVPADVVNNAPDVVKKLGCTPSFNVYDDPGSPESLPDDLRTTGCHLHMSHSLLKDEEIRLNLVKWADVLVGCVWSYISPEGENEALRRKAYGRAGEYRPTSYKIDQNPIYLCWGLEKYSSGVEYRVLPGAVIKHPAYMTLMFNLYRTALRFANTYKTPPETLTDPAREAINNADKKLAEKVISALPFQSKHTLFFESMRNTPLRNCSPDKWFKISQNHCGRGHQYVFINRQDVGYKITDSYYAVGGE